MAATTTGPTALWYLTRATGVVTLILLTLSVALGVANARRASTEHVPRFVFDAVHRNASLLGVAFLFVHIITSLLDGFAPIRLVDAVIPFRSAYRPLWLGLGAVAFDLLVAVTLTSVFRRRLGYRSWRTTHWLAYASWPVALVHGLGTGSDTNTTWMLALTGACLIVVIVAVLARATAGWPDHFGARLTTIAASAAVPLGLLVWLPSGPLAAGWAERAGTPSSLLAAASSHPSRQSRSATVPRSESGVQTNAAASFAGAVSGTVSQTETGDGSAVVHMLLSVAGEHLSALHLLIEGHPIDGGGVAMRAGEVTLGTGSEPHLYRGRVTALEGTNIHAQVTSASGAALALIARLRIDPTGDTVTGTLTAAPPGGQG
ncbi:MAG: ferric reductase-like transmembrane domain-containing protein [Solirubrobacteraceae bacterium]